MIGAGVTGWSRWLPKSTGMPSMMKLPALPPMRSARSSTATPRQPRWESLYAAARPAGPAPSTTNGGAPSGLGILQRHARADDLLRGSAFARFVDDLQIARDHRALAPARVERVVGRTSQLVAALTRGLQAPHRREQIIGGVEECAAARLREDLGERSEPPRDDRRRVAERLDHRDAERLETDRRHQQCNRMRIVGLQRFARQPSEETYVRQARRPPLQLFAMIALTSDDKIGGGVFGEERKHFVEALDALQAADEQEVRPLVWPRQHRARTLVRIRQEVRQHRHVARETEFAMFLAAELTHRDEDIHLI